jgi:putative ATP-dependent endonuclease of OLD family
MPKITIRQLHILRYRGFESLTWNPAPGLNLIIGGGDCGKTTLLEAIGLLLHPSNSLALTEADYFKRNTEEGFEIEAVISVSEDFDFSSGSKTYWPWEWDGLNAVQPRLDADEAPEVQIPVYRVRVSASVDFELSWEIIQPDETINHFSVGLRRQIGLVKLTGDDKNDRDLRLVYGSALDRLLSDDNLRSKVSQTIAQVSLTEQLSDGSKKSLEELDKLLSEALLPSQIALGLTGSQGVSIGALIGLFAQKDDVALPLSSWGAGTRRMTSLKIAAAKKTDAEIALVDEIERGLEPYRLRKFIKNLIDTEEQCFVTTHSPIAVASISSGQIWYLDSQSNIGKLEMEKIRSQLSRDPETFLSRIAVIVEGETEQGFVDELLKKALDGDILDAGICVCNGQGDAQLLDLLEELQRANLTFCGFVDRDGAKQGRWDALKERMGDRLFHWEQGCIETNLIPLIPDDQIERLLQDDEGDWDGNRLRTIAERLGTESKDFDLLLEAVGSDRNELKQLIIQAATGDTTGIEEQDAPQRKSTEKAWKKHARFWFKRADGSGGRELLSHVRETGKWQELEPSLRPFFNSVRQLASKPAVASIEL